MQTTELDPSLSVTLQKADTDELMLVISNKHYSSWSMRPWVAMTAFSIPFKENRILRNHSQRNCPLFGQRPATYPVGGGDTDLGFTGHL